MKALPKPLRVSLKEWSISNTNQLVLYFQKVPSFLTKRDFQRANFPVTVFTDFGYLKIVLTPTQSTAQFEWLDNYLEREDVFLEQTTDQKLIFWNGEEEDAYDWSSDYEISFAQLTRQNFPLSEEEWKHKYREMTLQWEKTFYDRQDIFLKEYLTSFVQITESMIDQTMKENQAEVLTSFKATLKQRIKSMQLQEEEISAEREAFFKKEDRPMKHAQRELNHYVKLFLQKLKSKWLGTK